MATQEEKEFHISRPAYRDGGRPRGLIGNRARDSNYSFVCQDLDKALKGKNKVTYNPEELNDACADPIGPLPIGPLSLWLSCLSITTHASTSVHIQNVSRMVDKELCIKAQCAMFQAKDEASIDQTIDRLNLRHNGKKIVKDAFKNYFDPSKQYKSKTEEYIFRLFSQSIHLSQYRDLDRKYWGTIGRIMRMPREKRMKGLQFIGVYSVTNGVYSGNVPSNDSPHKPQPLQVPQNNEDHDEKEYDPSQDVDISPIALQQQQKEEQMKQQSQIQRDSDRYASHNGGVFGGLDAIQPQHHKSSKNKPVIPPRRDEMNDEEDAKYDPHDGHKSSRCKPVALTPKARAKRMDADRKCYIPKQVSRELRRDCVEEFDCDASLFDYMIGTYKLQEIDEQISPEDVIETEEHGPTWFVCLDLHFVHRNRKGQVVYGVIVHNDDAYIERWGKKMIHTMTALQIANRYHVTADRLPLSSRKMKWFKIALRYPPCDVSIDVVLRTNFVKLPTPKYTKNGGKGKIALPDECLIISCTYFARCCRKSLNQGPMVPVIMVIGKTSRLEWIRFIKVCSGHWVAISLAYFASNKRWKITCVHCDPVRLWRQHRLVGLDVNHRYYCSYDAIAEYIRNLKSVKIVA